MFKNNKSLLWFTLIIPIGFLIGTYLGIQFSSDYRIPVSFGGNNGQDRVSSVIDYVDRMYVDDVERERLIEVAINAITQELDPHSAYLNPEELALMQEPMQGHFFGIGVEFMLINDTINVLKTVANGPSEKAGLKRGDKILYAANTKLFGDSVSNPLILKTLKGEQGTKVDVTIQRGSDSLNFTITRGSIPIPSVIDYSVLHDSIAFIKVLRFAETTDEEFLKQMDAIVKQGLKNVIIDLRNNGGGYLNSTIRMCEQMLDKGDLIVYTEGKARPRQNFYAKGNPKYKGLNYFILINENSASASEVMAGAFQDNDKAVIIGVRSFGKGLVQEEHNLPENTALRLTVARYYTPSGRSIQKVYSDSAGKMIDRETYYQSEYHGLLDSTEFYTKSGRVVYGGGGIKPDIASSQISDTNDANQLSMEMSGLFPLIAYGAINAECFKYAESKNFEFGSPEKFNESFDLRDFLSFVKDNNPDIDINPNYKKYSAYDSLYMKALCARYIYNESEAQKFALQVDSDIDMVYRELKNKK